MTDENQSVYVICKIRGNKYNEPESKEIVAVANSVGKTNEICKKLDETICNQEYISVDIFNINEIPNAAYAV